MNRDLAFFRNLSEELTRKDEFFIVAVVYNGRVLIQSGNDSEIDLDSLATSSTLIFRNLELLKESRLEVVVTGENRKIYALKFLGGIDHHFLFIVSMTPNILYFRQKLQTLLKKFGLC